MKHLRRSWNWNVAAATALGALCSASTPAVAQPLRVLGVDISYWNCGTASTGISQANWNTAYTTGNRVFVQIRATRGGTTGLSQTSGTPGNPTSETLSRRYDDCRFLQNITRATVAGMMAGPYHFARPDVAGNTGTDEADHFIEMAGVFMRPGYLMPMYDLEATSGDNNVLRQFSIDFSARLYAVMQIRPCIYINGNYSSLLDSGATTAQKNALAQPAALTPSVVGPAYPMLWNARYSDNTTNWVTIPVQTGSPKYTYTTSSGYYSAWDDYGDSNPWSFWQYASVASIPGFNAVDTTIDVDVSHGDIEYVRNYLVPAVWWSDSSGDWSTLMNWNSGQPAPAPVVGTGQAAPYAYTTNAMPIARLPGAAGTGPTAGQYDTVLLERPNANISVTLSTGTHNVRKLYMRETLNLTGGSLTINYNPTYRADNSADVLHGGPISAQFSGPVTLNGGSLNVHTLQVDGTRTFTLTAGTLAFSKLILMPNATPAKLAVSGDITFGAYPSATAVVTNGTGTGSSGQVDLTGGTRTFSVASGVDLFIKVPVLNGGLTKSGLGTLHLDAVNSYTGGTTLTAGTLEAGGASSLSGKVTNTAGTLKLDHAAAMPSSATLVLASSPGNGAVNLNFAGTQTVSALYFGPTRKAAGTWAAAGAAHTSAAFTGAGMLNVLSGPASTTIVSRTTGASPAAYGDALTFTATVTGNLPSGTVQFRLNGVAVGAPVPLVGGSASLVTNSLPVSGSAYQLTAAYSGDDNNNPSDSSASPLLQTITALPLTAVLTGTVSKAYDGTTAAALAPANYSLPGVLSGDSVALNHPTSGAYDTKDAGTGKTVTVSGLAIAGPSATNYTLTSPAAAGAVGVIQPLATACAFNSTVNPAGLGSQVTFTASVNGVPPAADLPTGDVIFSANGIPFATNALASGSSSASTDSLPVGTNVLTAWYLGDGNFLGATGSLAQVVQSLATCSETNAVVSIANHADGTFTLTFVGTPQAQYYLLASPDLAAPMSRWTPVAGSTNTVTNSSGLWQFTATNSAPQQFYRSAAVAPCP